MNSAPKLKVAAPTNAPDYWESDGMYSELPTTGSAVKLPAKPKISKTSEQKEQQEEVIEVCDPTKCNKKDRIECQGTAKWVYDYFCSPDSICTYYLSIEDKSIDCGYEPCNSIECDKKDKEDCQGTTKRVYDYYCSLENICTYNLIFEENSIDCAYEETVKEQPELQNLVTKVIDGDTVQLATGERVRLICIDTPEKGLPYYAEAKSYLAYLILNKEVRLEKDVSETDRYGRLLRYIYTGDTFVNGELVEKGYAKVSKYPPDTKYCSYLEYLETDAKNKGLGIWSENQQIELAYICNYNAYNCDDFKTHAQAQAAYEACGVGNDIHNLDGDKDGLACETLP